jgi:hypothetical protein
MDYRESQVHRAPRGCRVRLGQGAKRSVVLPFLPSSSTDTGGHHYQLGMWLSWFSVIVCCRERWEVSAIEDILVLKDKR